MNFNGPVPKRFKEEESKGHTTVHSFGLGEGQLIVTDTGAEFVPSADAAPISKRFELRDGGIAVIRDNKLIEFKRGDRFDHVFQPQVPAPQPKQVAKSVFPGGVGHRLGSAPAPQQEAVVRAVIGFDATTGRPRIID